MKIRFHKKYIGSIILCLLGLSCHATFVLVGSDISNNGTLIEPFFLIPIGFLLMGLGIGISLVILLFRF